MSVRPVVATSFPPRTVRSSGGALMPDYDRYCVKSWIACGFRVIAVNPREEIPALSARHPEIEFVATDALSDSLYGRPLPFLCGILSALARTGEPLLGIINSDLIFEPSPQWQAIANGALNKTVIIGRRYDVRTLSGGVIHPFLCGFDYFFFDAPAADALAAESALFAIGMPWWDYWLPLVLALRGYAIREFGRPAALHLAHDSPPDPDQRHWRQLAIEYARALAREIDNRGAPTGWDDLTALCRAVADPRAQSDKSSLDANIIELSNHSVRAISPKLLNPTGAATADGAAAGLPSAWFESLPSRYAAGESLYDAIRAEQRGDKIAARVEYLKAARGAPNDPAIFSNLGILLCNDGDLVNGIECLQRAASLAPSVGSAWSRLGSALCCMRRTDEAAACFRKAIECDPLDGSSYHNLALALLPRNRHGEVIARLERQVAANPDFTEGQAWLSRIRAAIAARMTVERLS